MHKQVKNTMEKASVIRYRVEMLRVFMRQHGLHAFIVPTSDAHASEYTIPYDECRKWISGFSGSAGTAVITLNEAALWTDSRYFIAAEEELKDTGYELMKEGLEETPDIAEWLTVHLETDSCVGLNGMVNSVRSVEGLQMQLAESGIRVDTGNDPFEEIWSNRPLRPTNEIHVHPLCFAGEPVHDKIKRLREALLSMNCDAMLVTALDEIAWLLNLRGSDIHCTPLFLAFCLVSKREVTLYVNRGKVTAEVAGYLEKENVLLKNYMDVVADISQYSAGRLLLPAEINKALYDVAADSDIVIADSPIASMKAVKNSTEIAGFRHAMERDGVALVKFLRWLKPAVLNGKETEISISKKLEQLRAAQEYYQDNSFDTIAAYAGHGAIVHYEATAETDVPLKSEGFLLLDSGAQYSDGTTDITRTIALGEPTQEEKLIYTLVLKGHIALSRCRFPSGACGTQLDLAARYAMWQEGYNFGHGTGHGVGSYLCVHEGPHQIRMNYKPAPISAGMVVTDEPGIYVKGKFGIRIENTLLCVPYKETEFGKFVQFEPLTLCPIDTSPIETSLLTPVEKAWLNNYHQHVRSRLLPLLSEKDDAEWLIDATKEI